MTSSSISKVAFSLFLSSYVALFADCPKEKEQREHCCKGHTSSMYFLDYADDFKLSDAQVAKLNKIRLSSEKDAKQFKLKSDLAEQELIKVSHDPQSDRKKVEKAIEAVAQADKEALKAEAFSILDARDVLNADQLKKMRELAAQPKPSCHGEK